MEAIHTRRHRLTTVRWMGGIGLVVFSLVGGIAPVGAQDWEGVTARAERYLQRLHAYHAELEQVARDWATLEQNPAMTPAAEKLDAALTAMGFWKLAEKMFEQKLLDDERERAKLNILWVFGLAKAAFTMTAAEAAAADAMQQWMERNVRLDRTRQELEDERRRLVADQARALEALAQQRAQLQEERRLRRESAELERAVLESQYRAEVWRWAASQIQQAFPRRVSCEMYSVPGGWLTWGRLTCY